VSRWHTPRHPIPDCVVMNKAVLFALPVAVASASERPRTRRLPHVTVSLQLQAAAAASSVPLPLHRDGGKPSATWKRAWH
jgi:hypothetical protein